MLEGADKARVEELYESFAQVGGARVPTPPCKAERCSQNNRQPKWHQQCPQQERQRRRQQAGQEDMS